MAKALVIVSTCAELLVKLANRMDLYDRVLLPSIHHVQRQWFDNNVTTFHFEEQDDGRLRPKLMTVYHVWSATSVQEGVQVKVELNVNANPSSVSAIAIVGLNEEMRQQLTSQLMEHSGRGYQSGGHYLVVKEVPAGNHDCPYFLVREEKGCLVTNWFTAEMVIFSDN